MTVTDKREKVRNKILFRNLDIGDVYEDEEGLICIKTTHADEYNDPNCIAFQKGDWEAYHQDLNSEVVKIATDLILRRDM